MKKKLSVFLKYLEVATSFGFNMDLMTAQENYIDKRNRSCCFSGLLMNNGPFLLVISMTKVDRKINGLVLVCLNEDEYLNAQVVQSKLQKAVPFIPVLYRNRIEDFMASNLIKSMKENF